MSLDERAADLRRAGYLPGARVRAALQRVLGLQHAPPTAPPDVELSPASYSFYRQGYERCRTNVLRAVLKELLNA